MTQSSFYHDGYRDGLKGDECSPPDVSVYASEYTRGYQDACESLELDEVLPGGREGPINEY